MGTGSAQTRSNPTLVRGRRRFVLSLSLFAALSCVVGGAELVIWPEGNRYLPPLDVLHHTPFADFAVPGAVLAVVVGGAQIVCGVLVYRRARGAVLSTVLAGGILSGWIIAEVGMMRGVYWLHGLYLAVGLALLAVGAQSALREKEPRDRWLVLVTAGEWLGFAFPAATGIVLSQLHVSGVVEVVGLGIAGAIEGLLLGAAQAWAWPLPVRRLRYAGLTALAACGVWVGVMSLMQWVALHSEPTVLLLTLGVSTAVLGLLAMGAAQWVELRHHSQRAWRFIMWTALAWLLALPFSFAPGPFVDETTPWPSQLALWSMGGLLMAAAMAMVTWLGVKALVAGEDAGPPRTA